jgi:hypothetical protein
MFVYASALVVFIVILGLLFRKKRSLHIPLMSSAFLIDLSLVLIIELQRQAIENVVVSKSPFVWFHVTISVTVLVLYIVLAITGSKMSKIPQGPLIANSKLIKIHKVSAVLFIILRLTNFFTSLSMPEQVHIPI